jgi:hypothetical protein
VPVVGPALENAARIGPRPRTTSNTARKNRPFKKIEEILEICSSGSVLLVVFAL